MLTFSCNKKTIYEFEKEWIRMIKPDLNLHSPVKENNEKDRERAREHYLESLKTRRYHCDVCDMVFGNSNNLKRHLRSLKHSNNYMNSVD